VKITHWLYATDKLHTKSFCLTSLLVGWYPSLIRRRTITDKWQKRARKIARKNNSANNKEKDNHGMPKRKRF